MRAFETNSKLLRHLLSQVHNGDLTQPDFQRDFAWAYGVIEGLIVSIMHNYRTMSRKDKVA